ncbi:hypothetical protein RF11_01078 [Thelohanellus kitauei]|uniref:Uncharacterized protein n=1 Tax=Thelohanellus kitauei TaxID=669202 RepID=A0A0C2JHE6_THEKT|nr:hypothetical protein RF11_01078 [Thelohanellus kitauei]
MGELLKPGQRKTKLSRFKIPDEILHNQDLSHDIMTLLPSKYSFEIHKTIWFIRQRKAKSHRYCECEVIISSDVVYGACCVDDFAAKLLDASVLIHYAHNPIQDTHHSSVLYVLVEIDIDIDHFVTSIQNSFGKHTKLSFVSTIQFVGSLQELMISGYSASVESCSPLTKGEILGWDGRFHIESAMIQNHSIPAYRYNYFTISYDPYTRILSLESYDYDRMVKTRRRSIEASTNGTYGIIVGTLGRQGSLKVLQASVVLNAAKWNEENYPMDYYARISGGSWTPHHETQNIMMLTDGSCGNHHIGWLISKGCVLTFLSFTFYPMTIKGVLAQNLQIVISFKYECKLTLSIQLCLEIFLSGEGSDPLSASTIGALGSPELYFPPSEC